MKKYKVETAKGQNFIVTEWYPISEIITAESHKDAAKKAKEKGEIEKGILIKVTEMEKTIFSNYESTEKIKYYEEKNI